MFKFRVESDSGDEYELVAKSRDVLKWERQGGGRSWMTLINTMNMKHLYELAHVAGTRVGVAVGTLSEFMDENDLALLGDKEKSESTVDEDGEDGEDPTRRDL